MYFDRIKKIAREKNMSIREIEINTGLSGGSIAKWNKSSPSVDNFKKVARYLGVDVNEFLKEKEVSK